MNVLPPAPFIYKTESRIAELTVLVARVEHIEVCGLSSVYYLNGVVLRFTRNTSHRSASYKDIEEKKRGETVRLRYTTTDIHFQTQFLAVSEEVAVSMLLQL